MCVCVVCEVAFLHSEMCVRGCVCVCMCVCVCVCCVRHQRFGSQPWDLYSGVITLFKKSNQKKLSLSSHGHPAAFRSCTLTSVLALSLHDPAASWYKTHTHTHPHRVVIFMHIGSSGMLTFACTHTHISTTVWCH